MEQILLADSDAEIDPCPPPGEGTDPRRREIARKAAEARWG